MFKGLRLAAYRRRISVTTKIALALSILLLFVIAIIGVSSFMRQRDILRQGYEKKGQEISSAIALFANEYIAFGQYDFLSTLVHKLKSYGNIDYITITDASGKVLVDTADYPEEAKIVNSKNKCKFTAPINPFGGNISGYVHVGLNTVELDNLPLEMAVNWSLLGLVVILASIFLATVLTKRILQKPLAELTAGTELVAIGDFSSRVNIPQQDELGDLGNCFNNMSFHLGNLIQSVNISIADIQKGMEQLAGSLQAVDRANSSLLRNLAGFKEDAGEQLNSLAKSVSQAEQLTARCRQINELQRVSSTLTGNALQAGEKGTVSVRQATGELDGCYQSLAEYQKIQQLVLDRGEVWSAGITNLAALAERLAPFVVETALEAAKSGNKELTNAAENLSQALQDTYTHLKELQLELTALVDASRTAGEALQGCLGQVKSLHDIFNVSAAAWVEQNQILQRKKELENELRGELEETASIVQTFSQGFADNLADLNKLLLDHLSANGRLQVADIQEIHSLVKKLLRLTDRLKALALQYKT